MKIKQKILFCSIALFFLVCQSLLAQEPEYTEEIKLYLGQIQSVATNAPYRVVVGNPEIADVSSVTTSEIILAPKKAGNTTFVFWDRYGEHSYRLTVLSEDLSAIKERVDTIIQDLNIEGINSKINEQEGKVFILGTLKTTADKDKLKKALDTTVKDKAILMATEADPLVQIDVQLLELTKSATEQLGITWQSSGLVTFTDKPPTQGTFTELMRVVEWSRDAFSVKVNTLINRGDGRLLSRPKLVCVSGKEANLTIGGEIPLVTTTTASTGVASTSVEYRNYGIVLRIRPTVKNKDEIYTTISTEVSDVSEWRTIAGSSYPVLTTKNTSTELYLKEGQTVIIAGLIKNKDTNSIQKFPALGDVPILGLLFKSKNWLNEQTDLVITLTPTIVKQAEAKPLSQPLTPLEKQTAIKTVTVSPQMFSTYRYIQRIQDKIQSQVYYPDIAREAGFEGEVLLSLHLFPEGKLEQVVIKASSGYQTLDRAALDVVKSLEPYPAFPSDIREQELWVDIPIVYKQN